MARKSKSIAGLKDATRFARGDRGVGKVRAVSVPDPPDVRAKPTSIRIEIVNNPSVDDKGDWCVYVDGKMVAECWSDTEARAVAIHALENIRRAR